MRFDGNETIKLEQDEATFNIQTPFSVCLWMNTEDLNAEVLESGRFSLSISDGFLIGKVKIGGFWKQTESIAVPSNVWFHLILSWDGNKIYLYRNNESAVTPVNTSGNLTGSGTLYLGGRSINEPYEGLIDDLRIFDQALSPAQRQEVYNFFDPALIAYFGEQYTYQIHALKGATDYNASNLPDGLFVDYKQGLIFGEAYQTGEFSVEVNASITYAIT